ncbi:MAG: hypothetical protein KJO99_01265 [Nitrosopumilus sp.]|nr:hypothetical protein [Nitrosopumilus sp.]NNL52618.1 hypothetical protein [Nitrosopumilus sp.]
MNFETELSQGNFYIPECMRCSKIVWPPSEFCNHCFGEIIFKKKIFEGRIIEFSRKNEEYFCLVEFENQIRVMAKMSNSPKIGQIVKLIKSGIVKGSYFFEVT